MIKINEITTGATVSMETTFTVTKVNKKSVVIQDSKGNTHLVRDRDFSKYGVVTNNTTKTKAKTSSSKKSVSNTKTTASNRKALPTLRGRYPKWANSAPKQNFVRAERAEGNVATPETYAEYRSFLKKKKKA